MLDQASPEVLKGTSWKEKVISYQEMLVNLNGLSQQELFNLEGSILGMFCENNLNVVNKVFLLVKAFSDMVPFTRIAVQEVVFVAFKFAGIKGLSLEPLIVNLFMKNDRKKIMNVLFTETRSKSNSRAIQAHRIILSLVKQYGLKETFDNQSVRSLFILGFNSTIPQIKNILKEFLKFLYLCYGEKTFILLTKELKCEILRPEIQQSLNSNEYHANPYEEFPMELFLSSFDFLGKYDCQSLLLLPTISIKSQIQILNEMMEDVQSNSYLLQGDYQPILQALFSQSQNNNKATSKLVFQILKNLVEKVNSLRGHSKLIFETLFKLILHKNIRNLIKQQISNNLNYNLNNKNKLSNMLQYQYLKEKLLDLAELEGEQNFKHIQFHRALLILELMLPILTIPQITQIKDILGQMQIISIYKIQLDHLLKQKLIQQQNQEQKTNSNINKNMID